MATDRKLGKSDRWTQICEIEVAAVPFRKPEAELGRQRPFRKLTLDVGGIEVALPSSAVFELNQMSNGKPRLLMTVPQNIPGLLRTLTGHLAGPLYLLYILHTPRGEGPAGRYQSPPLDNPQVDEFLTTFEAFFAGDSRHEIWVYSPGDRRTLVWDRHDLVYAEGDPIGNLVLAIEEMGFESGKVPRAGERPHIHYYRPEYDSDAAMVLASFDWTWSELKPEDEQ